jgi:hypothetical protein
MVRVYGKMTIYSIEHIISVKGQEITIERTINIYGNHRQARTGSSSYVYKKTFLCVVHVIVSSSIMPATAKRVLQLALCCVIVAARPGNQCT